MASGRVHPAGGSNYWRKSMISGNIDEVGAVAVRARECLHEARERLRSGGLLPGSKARLGWPCDR